MTVLSHHIPHTKQMAVCANVSGREVVTRSLHKRARLSVGGEFFMGTNDSSRLERSASVKYDRSIWDNYSLKLFGVYRISRLVNLYERMCFDLVEVEI